MSALVSDDLNGFMPLARDNEHIAGFCQPHRRANGLSAILDDFVSASRRVHGFGNIR